MRESDIDRALERILLMRFRLGEFGSPIKPWSEVGPNVVGAAAHAKLALQAARESITLTERWHSASKQAGAIPLLRWR